MPRSLSEIDAERERLLGIVEDMVRRRGGVSISLADLASEAGISASALSQYFESREALYEAAAERWFAPKVAVMEEVVASELPVRDKLYAFFARRYVMMKDNYQAEPALFESYLDLGDEHFEIVRGYIDLGDHYLAMIVAEAMDSGHFAGVSVDRVVSLINLTVNSFINPRLIIDLRHSLTEEKLGQLIDMLLRGIKADDTRPTPRLMAV